jgi:hypothetical protein
MLRHCQYLCHYDFLPSGAPDIAPARLCSPAPPRQRRPDLDLAPSDRRTPPSVTGYVSSSSPRPGRHRCDSGPLRHSRNRSGRLANRDAPWLKADPGLRELRGRHPGGVRAVGSRRRSRSRPTPTCSTPKNARSWTTSCWWPRRWSRSSACWARPDPGGCQTRPSARCTQRGPVE